MGKDSSIEWTTHTFNPWWGCIKVSDGCKNCYANALDKRYGGNHWGPNSERKFFGDKHWEEPLKWNKVAADADERPRVFCASMADVFEGLPANHPQRDLMTMTRIRLFREILLTPNLDWLLLTKRIEDVMPLIHDALIHATEDSRCDVVWNGGDGEEVVAMLGRWLDGFPPASVWLGTTVENQKATDERIPILLQVPATVRFLSVEPQLEAVTLPWQIGGCNLNDFKPGIHQIICGGESGPGARPFHLEWAYDLLAQSRALGIPFFMKQVGSNAYFRNERFKTRHHKGGDLAELPEDLRVREFPTPETP